MKKKKIEDFGNVRFPSDNHPFPNAAQNSNQRQSNVPVINGGKYGEGSMEAPGFRQWQLIEEGEGATDRRG